MDNLEVLKTADVMALEFANLRTYLESTKKLKLQLKLPLGVLFGLSCSLKAGFFTFFHT